jgi:hypothetical protein
LTFSASFQFYLPLFGLELEDYDSLFAEKLDLLLNIRENTHVHWSGKHRAPLTGQGVYPRSLQDPLPVWLGVGGTPGSFIRAGNHVHEGLLKKVSVRPNHEYTDQYPKKMPAKIRIKLKDGKTIDHEVQDYPGLASHPFAWEESVDKFDLLVEQQARPRPPRRN